MVRKGRYSRFPRKRRFRRNKGTWFPVNGDVWVGEGASYYDASASAWVPNVPIAKDEGPYNLVFPVTQDYTFNASQYDAANPQANPSLRDYVEGQDYILHSLVGNCFVTCSSPWNINSERVYDRTETWQFIQVTAGFFVARASDADPSLPDLTKDEVDPQCGLNIQDPWIWRRQWILANPSGMQSYPQLVGDVPAPAGGTKIYTEPRSTTTDNWQYPALTGPHFHTKSRRRVRREERLWFSLSAMGWDGNQTDVSQPAEAQPGFKFALDVRLFGKMVKGRNASTF